MKTLISLLITFFLFLLLLAKTGDLFGIPGWDNVQSLISGDSTFWKEWAGFVISLGAALICYVASLVFAFAKSHPMRILFVFLVVGCLAISAQQWLGHQYEKEEKRLDEVVKVSLEQIKGDVSETRGEVSATHTLLEAFIVKASSMSLAGIGTMLVKIEPNRDNDIELRDYEKGTPLDWEDYAQWLLNPEGFTSELRCLTLYVNADHNYMVDLILLYIMTNKETEKSINKIFNQPGQVWRNFTRSGNRFWSENGNRFAGPYREEQGGVRYVLFFDGQRSQNNLIGYAESKAFARELLVYKELSKETSIEQLLGKRGGAQGTGNELESMFASFRQNIIHEAAPGKIVEEMIRKKQSEAVVYNEQEMFLVKLTDVIELATK